MSPYACTTSLSRCCFELFDLRLQPSVFALDSIKVLLNVGKFRAHFLLLLDVDLVLKLASLARDAPRLLGQCQQPLAVLVCVCVCACVIPLMLSRSPRVGQQADGMHYGTPRRIDAGKVRVRRVCKIKKWFN